MSDRIVTFEMGKWDFNEWQQRFANHFKQQNVLIAINQVYLDMTTKYVPFKTGALTWSGRVLRNPVRIQWGYDRKKPNYAIYPYLGIARNGNAMRFNKTVHPFARARWDMAVKEHDMAAYTREVTYALKKIAREEGW